MCSNFESYQPISMSRNPPYGQVLMLGVHSLDACKTNAVRFLRCPNRQLTDNIQHFGGRKYGSPMLDNGQYCYSMDSLDTLRDITLRNKPYCMGIEG